jgi:hypothetical protein
MARISIYNLKGQKLFSFDTSGGVKEHWNAESYPSGLYIIAAEQNGKVAYRKAMLMK